MRILYMEDDEGLVYLLRNTLEAADFEVIWVPNGEQGLEILRREPFDAVVIDQEMPIMTGLEVIQKIADIQQAPPIIMVTGAGNEEVAVQAMRAGASDYLVKDTSLVYLQMLPSVIRQVMNEREHARARQAAERALLLEKDRSRLLTQFIQDASHEFRTPLTTIQTSTELLARLTNEPKLTPYIERIQQQGKVILKLVTDLMKLAELDNTSAFRLTPVHLNSLIEEVLEKYRSTFQERDIRLELSLPGAPIMVLGNAVELHYALGELVNNACRYSQPGATLSIDLDQNDVNTLITIRDTGIGISSDELPHIFERFYRVDKAHSTPGFGLGLPIAARILELHGGQIQVESQPGQGTTVVVRLPRNSDPK